MNSIFYGSYPDYNTITHRVTRNKLLFPQLFADSFGKSAWGKNLWCAGLGDLQNALLVVGGMRGCDYMGILCCFAFLEYLLKSDDPYLQNRLHRRGVMVVPCLDPDGLTLWLDGVFAAPDPQKAYDLWCGGTNQADPTTNFCAERPETDALQALCQRYSPRCAVCFEGGKDAVFAPACDTAGKILSFLSGDPLCRTESELQNRLAQTFGCPAYIIGQKHTQSPLRDFERLRQKCLPQLLALLCLPV